MDKRKVDIYDHMSDKVVIRGSGQKWTIIKWTKVIINVRKVRLWLGQIGDA